MVKCPHCRQPITKLVVDAGLSEFLATKRDEEFDGVEVENGQPTKTV